MLNLCGWNGLADEVALPARQGMKTNFENQENESRGVWSTTQSRLNELTTYWWLILGKTGIGQIGAVKRGLSSNPQRQKGEGENSTYWLSWKILDIDKVSWEVSDLTHRVNNWVETPIQISHGCWRWEHSRFWPKKFWEPIIRVEKGLIWPTESINWLKTPIECSHCGWWWKTHGEPPILTQLVL